MILTHFVDLCLARTLYWRRFRKRPPPNASPFGCRGFRESIGNLRFCDGKILWATPLRQKVRGRMATTSPTVGCRLAPVVETRSKFGAALPPLPASTRSSVPYARLSPPPATLHARPESPQPLGGDARLLSPDGPGGHTRLAITQPPTAFPCFETLSAADNEQKRLKNCLTPQCVDTGPIDPPPSGR